MVNRLVAKTQYNLIPKGSVTDGTAFFIKAFWVIVIVFLCGSCVYVFNRVIITDQSPDVIQLDPFDLEGVEIVGDTVTLSISYGGGCEEHCFSLYMSPAAFLESYPVQANLYLRHDSNGDACEALINEDISFNLLPVAVLYKKLYGQFDEIVINVFKYRSNDNLNETYSPE